MEAVKEGVVCECEGSGRTRVHGRASIRASPLRRAGPVPTQPRPPHAQPRYPEEASAKTAHREGHSHRAWPQRRVSARMRLILLRGVVRARENGAESRHRGGRRCGVAYGGALCVELP